MKFGEKSRNVWLVFLNSLGAILNAACVGKYAGIGDIGTTLFHGLIAVFCFVLVVLFATIWKPKEKGEWRTAKLPSPIHLKKGSYRIVPELPKNVKKKEGG